MLRLEKIGEDCLILRAFKLKDTNVKMILPDKPKLCLSVCRDVWAGPMESNAQYDSGTISQIVSRDLFRNTRWLEMTKNILDPLKIMGFSVLNRTLTQSDFESAGKLQTLLTERLCVHISRKVDDKHQKHWVWDFFK